MLTASAAGAAITFTEGANTVTTPNFEWNFVDGSGNVERVEGLKWSPTSGGALGANIAASGGGAGCGGPSEFWGQSYGNADGQGPGPVVAGGAGTWVPRGQRTVELDSTVQTNCSGDEPAIPVRTRYTFFNGGVSGNMVRMERHWSFAATQEPYVVQGMRAYVPRLSTSPYDQEIWPNGAGTLVTQGICNVCIQTDWSKTNPWVAINASGSNSGLLILRDLGNASPASVTLDYDSSSGSNNTGVSLDRPLPNGWTAPLTETEYFCFYDATTWPVLERAKDRLPDGCKPVVVPINTGAPVLSPGAGNPRAGEQFTAAPGTWDNATGAPFAYQWSRCVEDACEPIGEATGTTYTAGSADVGKALKITVTATAPGGETDTAESNVAGFISGHVYEGSKGPGIPGLANAPVTVCRRSGSPCRSTVTDANGLYRLQVPVSGKYQVTAFPPASSKAASHTRATIARVRPEKEKTGQDVILPLPKLPPPEVSFSGSGVRGKTAEGVPVVHWAEPFVIEYESDKEDEVEALVDFADGHRDRYLPQQPVLASPDDPEKSIFKFQIGPLYPNHGEARVTIIVRHPATKEEEEQEEEEQEAEEEEEEAEEEEEEEEDEEEEDEEEEQEDKEPDEGKEHEKEEEKRENEEEKDEKEKENGEKEPNEPNDPGPDEVPFPIYIDPSGMIRTATGAPLPGATVTLFRSDTKDGPFSAVTDGSAAMSPMNRTNPDVSEADGHFGWDVIAGFYKVRAQKSGCNAPGAAGQAFVETPVQNIPPPVTDLEIRLECSSVPTAPPTIVKPLLRVLLKFPGSAGSVRVTKQGAFTVRSATIECPAGSTAACTADVSVIGTAPPAKKGGKRKRQAKSIKLGSSKLTVPAGKSGTLTGKLSGSGLAALKKAKSIKAKISVSASVAGGDEELRSLGATLLAPKKPPKR